MKTSKLNNTLNFIKNNAIIITLTSIIIITLAAFPSFSKEVDETNNNFEFFAKTLKINEEYKDNTQKLKELKNHEDYEIQKLLEYNLIYKDKGGYSMVDYSDETLKNNILLLGKLFTHNKITSMKSDEFLKIKDTLPTNEYIYGVIAQVQRNPQLIKDLEVDIKRVNTYLSTPKKDYLNAYQKCLYLQREKLSKIENERYINAIKNNNLKEFKPADI